jgi:hypothetical protein
MNDNDAVFVDKITKKYKKIRKKWDINPVEQIQKPRKKYDRSKDRQKIDVNSIEFDDDFED